MSEPLLAVLRLCLLALLYLFFLRVLRAVWTEIRGPKTVPASAMVAAGPELRRRGKREPEPIIPRLRVIDPPALHGRTFDLGEELTIGRAAGCHITLDDTFVSQIHARVFLRDGHYLIEDLGSTNGTYLNRQKVSGPMVVRPGDQVQVGNVVLELV